MTWAGTSRTTTYTVRKDTKHVDLFLYYSFTGNHKLTMAPSRLYDTETKVVNAVDTNPAVAFEGNISTDAVTATADSIKDSLNNHCDVSTFNGDPTTNMKHRLPIQGHVQLRGRQGLIFS